MYAVAAGRTPEQGGMPRASTPRSARVTDGYDSDSDDDDVNEVGTLPFCWPQCQRLIGAIQHKY